MSAKQCPLVIEGSGMFSIRVVIPMTNLEPHQTGLTLKRPIAYGNTMWSVSLATSPIIQPDNDHSSRTRACPTYAMITRADPKVFSYKVRPQSLSDDGQLKQVTPRQTQDDKSKGNGVKLSQPYQEAPPMSFAAFHRAVLFRAPDVRQESAFFASSTSGRAP